MCNRLASRPVTCAKPCIVWSKAFRSYIRSAPVYCRWLWIVKKGTNLAAIADCRKVQSSWGWRKLSCSGLPEPIILPQTSFWLIILSVCPYLFSLNKWHDFISDWLNTPPTRRSLWHAFLICLQDPRNFWSTFLNITKFILSCRLGLLQILRLMS